MCALHIWKKRIALNQNSDMWAFLHCAGVPCKNFRFCRVSKSIECNKTITPLEHIDTVSGSIRCLFYFPLGVEVENLPGPYLWYIRFQMAYFYYAQKSELKKINRLRSHLWVKIAKLNASVKNANFIGCHYFIGLPSNSALYGVCWLRTIVFCLFLVKVHVCWTF